LFVTHKSGVCARVWVVGWVSIRQQQQQLQRFALMRPTPDAILARGAGWDSVLRGTP
jgi:hypothetical protein